MDLSPQEKLFFNQGVVYRDRGAYLRRIEQLEAAAVAFDKAFETNSEDVGLLLGRSQVYTDKVEPDKAYKDAELALKLNPKNMSAMHTQARAFYTLGEFEKSVAANYRGSWRRQQPPYFREGIIQGVETIQECIGKKAGNVMVEFLPIIKKHQSIAFDEESKPEQRQSRIPRQENKQILTQETARRRELLTRVLANKYIGPMLYDKLFLRQLADDPILKSANVKGSQDLKQIVHDALRSLNERQEILRTQRPYYSVKHAEKSKSHYQDEFRKRLLANEVRSGTRTAELYLRQLDKCLHENKIKFLVAKAERMQMFLDSKTPRTLPDKDLFEERLYKVVGKAYLSMHRLSYKVSEHSNRRRVAFLMGLPIGRPTSYDSVVVNYPYRFCDLQLAIEINMRNLEMCENPTKKCYLMYKISTLLAEQKNFSLSKFYAKRCQLEAQNIGSTTWWMNGCLALLCGDMQQGNVNEVRAVVEEAYEWTKKMSGSERIQAFLAKCLEIASETVPADERKTQLIRERRIIRTMDPALKTETEVLFKRISLMPHGRRFSVLPTKSLPFTESVRHKRKQKGLSVVPGPVAVLPKPPKTHVLGYQKFDF